MQQPKTALRQPFQFDSIEDALADLKAGRCLVVVDDESRENEGNLVTVSRRTNRSYLRR